MVRIGVDKENNVWIDYTGNVEKVVAQLCVGIDELLDTISKDSKIDLDYLKATFVTTYKAVNKISSRDIEFLEMFHDVTKGVNK